MAAKPNGSAPTHADYTKLKAAHDKTVADLKSTKAELKTAKHQLEHTRTALDTAVRRGDNYKSQLDAEVARRPKQAEAQMRAEAESGQLSADMPRWMRRAGDVVEERIFPNQAAVDAAEAAEPGMWFPTLAEAQTAWLEKQATPLPEDDGQTEAEATT